MDTNRRAALLGTASVAAIVGMGMGGLAGCPTTQNIDIIKTVADLIKKVQQGVVDLCAKVSKLVPTVDTVLVVIESFLETTLTAANLAIAITFVQRAVDVIAAAGCPDASGRVAASATIKGQPVVIKFY